AAIAIGIVGVAGFVEHDLLSVPNGHRLQIPRAATGFTCAVITIERFVSQRISCAAEAIVIVVSEGCHFAKIVGAEQQVSRSSIVSVAESCLAWVGPILPRINTG